MEITILGFKMRLELIILCNKGTSINLSDGSFIFGNSVCVYVELFKSLKLIFNLLNIISYCFIIFYSKIIIVKRENNKNI